MLEMVFNEINPYRESNLLDLNNHSGGSITLRNHSTGFYGNQTIDENSVGGSVKLPMHG